MNKCGDGEEKEGDQVIYNLACLYKDKELILSPKVFLKAEIPDLSNNQSGEMILVFENILALINFSYYSHEYDLENILQEIKRKKEMITKNITQNPKKTKTN